MRDAYHEDLDAIGAALVRLTGLVESAITRATVALMQADLTAAEAVIAGDEEVDDLYRWIEARSLDLLARQQPVAGDLRTLVGGLRMVSDLERVGDYAVHIAKVARRRYPAGAVPPELRDIVAEMGATAASIVAKAGVVIAERDVAAARELESDDDVMDALQRRLFRVLLDGGWPHGMEAAIDITLTGRYYERLADHAVSVARQLVYLVTGEHGWAPAHG
ncbi:MAG TPA: phosphate signaling complex protein PhoU [Mycobacteriales bacterium]|jgi:phosphate transport system protein|nr:phosphate signaling complex protein PhoU [Mycobacteriales bacterium]